MSKYNLKRTTGIAAAITIAVVLVSSTPAAASPSGVFQDAIDAVFGEIVSVAQIILFAYGGLQVIRVPFADERTGPLKQLGIAWGVAIVLEGWKQFQTFVNDSAETVGMTAVDPLTTVVSPDQLTMATDVMLSTISVLV